MYSRFYSFRFDLDTHARNPARVDVVFSLNIVIHFYNFILLIFFSMALLWITLKTTSVFLNDDDDEDNDDDEIDRELIDSQINAALEGKTLFHKRTLRDQEKERARSLSR